MKRLVLIAVCCLAVIVPSAPAYARSSTRPKAWEGDIIPIISPQGQDKLTCTYCSPVKITAKLTNSKGRAVAKKTLVLKRDGVVVGSYKTNKKGVVVAKVKFLGTAHWKFAFKGDKKYKGYGFSGQDDRGEQGILGERHWRR
jgi:hypothetical protein